MTHPRGLTAAEAEAWARVAATVSPLDASERRAISVAPAEIPTKDSSVADAVATPPKVQAQTVRPSARTPPPPAPPARDGGLDSHWERRLRGGVLTPDFTLDLHEHTLDAAYMRLLGGLDIARETGARVVLVIAGRQRPAAAADRAGQRGAIRAKLLDWLAASRHAAAIAAIRPAHRRHGGEGALYVILRKSA